MKNILIDILSSRIFQIGGFVCLLLTGGVYFYTQWDLARYEASLPKEPLKDTPSEAINPNTTDAPPRATGTLRQQEDAPDHTHAPSISRPKPRLIGVPSIPNLGQHPPQKHPPRFPDELIWKLVELEDAYPESYKEKQRALVANHYNLDLEDTESLVQFYEEYQIYDSDILERLNLERGFEYLKNVRRMVPTEDKIGYARRVLAENPTHLEARLYIIGTEQDNAVAAAMYRQLAKIHPDSPYPLERLGGRLHYDNPVEAIAALKKAQALGSLQADMDLGRAYERLGNYKAAWVHYYKYLMRYPDGQIPLSHMARLSEGQPHYPPIQLETTIPVDHAPEERTPGPPDHAPSIKRTENDVDGGNALPLNESSWCH